MISVCFITVLKNLNTVCGYLLIVKVNHDAKMVAVPRKIIPFINIYAILLIGYYLNEQLIIKMSDVNY